MIDRDTFYIIAWTWLLLAIPVFILLQFVTAPFGRHTRKDWGVMINNRVAWVLMEAVSLFTFSYFFLAGDGDKTPVTWLFASFWAAHYINRAFIYPFRMRTGNKKMPAVIFVFAIFFNLINGFINGYYLGNLSDAYAPSWLLTPMFIIGIILFIGGMAINDRADHILLNLRKPGETGYKIPRGFIFKYISCPNHFGEIIEWTGFAIMTWNIASLSFAVWTFANLAPRAQAHHRWYKQHFSHYPKKRKAVFPGLF